MAGADMEEMPKLGCFNGVSACFVGKEMNEHRLKLLSNLFRKHDGQEVSTIESGIGYSFGTSWIDVESSIGENELLSMRTEKRVKILSFEWICAYLEVRELVDVEKFDLFMLNKISPPVASPCEPEGKRLKILVPGPRVVDRWIAKVKWMDARFALKQQRIKLNCEEMDIDIEEVRALEIQGKVAAAGALKERVNVKWGWSDKDWS